MPRFLNQRQVVNKLSFDAKRMLRDRVELPAADIAKEEWRNVLNDIEAFARGVWQQSGAAEHPFSGEMAKQRVAVYMGERLRVFRNWLADTLNDTKRQAFEHQFLVDHWILDQVTPPNIKVRPKRDMKLYKPTGGMRRQVGAKEAWYDEPATQYSSGGGGAAGGWWDEPVAGQVEIEDKTGKPVPGPDMRLDLHLKAWALGAVAALAVAAVMADDEDDVEFRLEHTKTDGGQKMEDVLSRLIKTEVQVSIADSDEAFAEDFDELLKRKYWKTMEDERVCPICQAMEGRTEARATYNIPAHPGCRCYWRMEPMSFKVLAGIFGAPQLGAGTMAVRDPETGELTGSMVIDFDGWKQAVAA